MTLLMVVVPTDRAWGFTLTKLYTSEASVAACPSSSSGASHRGLVAWTLLSTAASSRILAQEERGGKVM